MDSNKLYYLIVNKDDIDIDDKSDRSKARYVLKQFLNYFNIDMPRIELDDNLKPYFKDSNIYFNYSHCKKYIACAISLHNLGIDIELSTRKISDLLADKYLDNERDNQEKIKKWVLKESYSKLKGLGIQMIKDININSIKEQNKFIDNKEYYCSIYCDHCVEFIKLDYKDIKKVD